MNRRLLLSISLASLASAVALACGSAEEETDPVDNTPIVGLYELPISRSNTGTEPTDALRLQVSPTEVRLDGRSVLALERGRPAEGEVEGHVITKLRERIQSSPARGRVALHAHISLPYVTYAEILRTLYVANQREVHVAVRTLGSSPTEGWMRLPNFQVVEDGVEVEWATRALPWNAFSGQWRPVYDACRAGQYEDCDAPYTNLAEGGDLAMELMTRGRAMRITFSQINAPEPAPGGGGGGGGGGVEMIEGIAPVAAPSGAPPEGESEPATRGSFTLNQAEATQEESALTATSQVVCGNAACRAEVTADASVRSMRIISMLGAVFPQGFSTPEVVFRLPPD